MKIKDYPYNTIEIENRVGMKLNKEKLRKCFWCRKKGVFLR
jgi:hypothetical protein